ncbi:MAG TPA: IS4/IS5 family transposase, partial [Lactococcus sp.]|nr:IS4/IS5 family transposase [Lactococcus sp.]
MAHIQEKNWKYLIRIKDVGQGGIASGLTLPKAEEFDVLIDLSLTSKQTNEVKELCKRKNKYRFVPSTSCFDFLPKKNCRGEPAAFYKLPFRIVRFKITDDSYESVVTNLDPTDFPPAELKKLYAMRWGIETSFRDLKYTVGLLHFHAKKVEHIYQEIFARLIMYNFTELITSPAIVRKADNKYAYKANFSVAVHVCRQFFLGNVSPPDV